MSNVMVKPESVSWMLCTQANSRRSPRTRLPARPHVEPCWKSSVEWSPMMRDRMRDLKRLRQDDRGVRGQIDRVVFRAGRSEQG